MTDLALPPVLGSAAHVHVRPVGLADLAALEALWSRCSPDTRSRRFLGALARPSWLVGGGPALTAPRLDLGAWIGVDLIGVASVVSDGADVWEVALLVEDAWQQRGVGSRLTADLVATATRHGVPRVVLTTPGDAQAVARLVERYATRWDLVWSGSGVLEYHADLVA
jgi:GNAT superfamily N-acetyltransferase